MNLITIAFHLPAEEQKGYVEALRSLQAIWGPKGLVVSLFHDRNQKDRFLQFFLADRSVEDLSNLLATDPEFKVLLTKIKDSQARVVVSLLEQVL